MSLLAPPTAETADDAVEAWYHDVRDGLRRLPARLSSLRMHKALDGLSKTLFNDQSSSDDDDQSVRPGLGDDIVKGDKGDKGSDTARRRERREARRELRRALNDGVDEFDEEDDSGIPAMVRARRAAARKAEKEEKQAATQRLLSAGALGTVERTAYDRTASIPQRLSGEAPPASLHDGERTTYVFYADTGEDPTQFALCSAYANRLARAVVERYGHAAKVVFGGDAVDAARGNTRQLWESFLATPGTKAATASPVAEQLALVRRHEEGHVCVLGNRDLATVRLMPYVELPPAWPPARTASDADAEAPEARAHRAWTALRAPVAVDADAFGLYNAIVTAWLTEEATPWPRDAPRFNATAFVKLCLLCNLTMDVANADAGHPEASDSAQLAGVYGGLVAAFVYGRGGSTIERDLVPHVLSIAERAVAATPSAEEVGAWRDVHPKAWDYELAAWTTLRTAESTRRTLDALVDEALAQGEQLARAMASVLDAVGAWTSDGGAMYALLCSPQGVLAHVAVGSNQHGVPWRVGALHAGTLLDPYAGGTDQDGARGVAAGPFAGECLGKLPTAYDQARDAVEWTPLEHLEAAGPDGLRASPEVWALHLNRLYRALVSHFAWCHATGVPRGLVYILSLQRARPIDDAAEAVHEADRPATRIVPANDELTGQLVYDWWTVRRLVVRLAGGGAGGASPAVAKAFVVPGAGRPAPPASATAERSVAAYARVDTAWLLAQHAHPTADRLLAPYVDLGYKAAYRASTAPWAPSFAVVLLTDSDRLVWDAHHALAQVDRLPPYREPPDLIARMALLRPPEGWGELVVGPEVLHLDAAGRATKARALLWHWDREHPERRACVFLSPARVDKLHGPMPPRAPPVKAVYGGVLVAPLPASAKGMGPWLDLSTAMHDATLEDHVRKRVVASSDDGEDGSVMRELRHLRTQIVAHAATLAACMWYAGTSIDRQWGLRLHARRGAAWAKDRSVRGWQLEVVE